MTTKCLETIDLAHALSKRKVTFLFNVCKRYFVFFKIKTAFLHFSERLFITSRHFGARSFAVAGPKAWNQLPADIRAIDSVNSFKSAL